MSEQLLQQIISSLNDLKSEQQSTNKRLDRMETGQKELQKDVKEIKTELRYVWDDIKRIDEKLTVHSEELQTLKRIK